MIEDDMMGKKKGRKGRGEVKRGDRKNKEADRQRERRMKGKKEERPETDFLS